VTKSAAMGHKLYNLPLNTGRGARRRKTNEKEIAVGYYDDFDFVWLRYPQTAAHYI
jgi:hypothetical protein